jgi:hypothetical protein
VVVCGAVVAAVALVAAEVAGGGGLGLGDLVRWMEGRVGAWVEQEVLLAVVVAAVVRVVMEVPAGSEVVLLVVAATEVVMVVTGVLMVGPAVQAPLVELV